MKKIILSLVITIMSITAYATESRNHLYINDDLKSKYELKIDEKNINYDKYLQFENATQRELFFEIQDWFVYDMKRAASKKDIGSAVKKAVDRNLKKTHAILNKEQYRKYVAVLNATFVNRNIYIKY